MIPIKNMQIEKKWSEWSLVSNKQNSAFSGRSKVSRLTAQPYSTHRKYVHTPYYITDIHKGPKKLGDIGIPGVQKLLEPDYGKVRKAFWFLAFIGCAMICVYQLQDRLLYYFQKHVTVDVTTRPIPDADFPAITVCPARQPFGNTSKYFSLIKDRCSISPDPNCINRSFSFQELNTSLEDIWSETGIKEQSLKVMTSCVVLESSNCDEDGDVEVSIHNEKLDTFWGACMIVYPKEPMAYKGPTFTYLDIKFHDVYLFDQDYSARKVLVQTYFHPPVIIQRHEAYLYADYIYKDYFTTIRLRGKEFKYQFRPCKSNLEVTECRNTCIDKILDSKVTCRLPFMKSTQLPFCQTLSDAQEAYSNAEAYYRVMDTSKCTCPKKCDNLVFSSEIDIEGKGYNNDTMLTIYKGDNMNEIITENIAYNFPSLLSDIGGTLGFFLGICMLNLLELLETIWDNVTSCRCCRQTTRRRSPLKKIRKKSPLRKSDSQPFLQAVGTSNRIIIAPQSRSVPCLLHNEAPQ